MAKKGFLLGLVLGGAAAYAAYRSMDASRRQEINDKARDHYNDLKDRAVDYAFYASDALDDFKDVVANRTADFKANAADWRANMENDADKAAHTVAEKGSETSTQFETAADHLRNELANKSNEVKDDLSDEDDIELSSDEALKTSDKAKVASSAKSEATPKADSATSAATSASSK
ncbi:hypothetical protein [Levilactobacillus bambusae]|uniref:YtxH domain-containing protein n=1 Tax=Levilactobacillus bambusae TaxID=2024736 RepID=A0A2V1MX44_9LACO|nr:hypothetical protein [Levilactobacillus bambusae]PWF99598.1 hypothetical protein DCM90_09155 [Levilactobacillus bambusae]